jgi:hypothetical protein
MRARAMLLLLRGPLMDVLTFCAFEKMGTTTTDKRHQQERLVARGRRLNENRLANCRRGINHLKTKNRLFYLKDPVRTAQ